MSEQNRQGKLVVISGFSGVGKGTVVKELRKQYDHYALSVSMTTRAPREGEQHGVSYFFVTKEEFEKAIGEGGFYEYANYQGRYYGTPRAFVDASRERGMDVILEIEVQGAMQIKEKFPDTLLIFIATKDAAEMERRLTGRGTESFDQITGRLKAAVGEAEQMQHYDYVVINDDLQECVAQMNGIILTEPEGPRYDPAFKEQFVKDLEEIVAKRTVQ